MPNQAYRIAVNDIEMIAEGGVRAPARAYRLKLTDVKWTASSEDAARAGAAVKSVT